MRTLEHSRRFRAFRTSARPAIPFLLFLLTAFVVLPLRVGRAGQANSAASGAPAPQQSTPKPSTGSISGHIYRADDGKPAVGVVIALIPIGKPTQNPAPLAGLAGVVAMRTGPDGAYRFGSLAGGRYQVQVTKGNGMNRRDPNQTVTLGEGESMDSVDLRLPVQLLGTTSGGVRAATPGTGTISGNVRDQNGAPIEGLQIQILSTSRDARMVGATETEDEGKFHAYGLPEGQYYVVARANAAALVGLVGYHQAYYPNADSAAKAKVVAVKADAETSDIQITVSFSPTHKISVKVVNATQGDDYTVYVSSVEPGDFESQPLLLDADRTAEVTGIPAGMYRIAITRTTVNRGPDGRVRGFGGGGPPIGSAVIQVGDSDVSIEIPISSFPPGGQR